jgi:hypothetical protein
MQQFVLCALAALMCVLCFAAGFVVAVLLRLADHSWFGRAGASPRLEERTPHPQEMPVAPTPVAPTPVAPTPVAVPQLQEVPAAALSVAVPVAVPEPPVQPEQWFLSAVPAEVPAQHHEAVPHRAAQLPAEHPMSREARDTATTAPTRAPGKVFLFGDPGEDHVAPPSLPPVRPGLLSNAGPVQQQAPLRIPPAEVDLLPRRP